MSAFILRYAAVTATAFMAAAASAQLPDEPITATGSATPEFALPSTSPAGPASFSPVAEAPARTGLLGRFLKRPSGGPPQPSADEVQSSYDNPKRTDKPEVVYDTPVPANENPSARGATVVPANGAAGAVRTANRQVNFPRDSGDDVDVLKLQIFLDWNGYSVAEIDGKWGYNTERSLWFYQGLNGLAQTGQIDDLIIDRLRNFSAGYLVEYTITDKDVKGPYYTIPRDYHAQAKLSYLPFEDRLEAIGEKFHSSPKLIQKLNPGIDFNTVQAGAIILAPNVVNGVDETRGSVSRVRISKSQKTITAFDSQGRFLFYYPCTLGSKYDPLPIGNYQINGVNFNPTFTYKPWLFWDADKSEPSATIPPGPNSPVGNVWIATSRPSVGIHGTPNPENISKNTSHGCIRLANWDAQQLGKRVTKGTPLEFVP